MGNKPRVGKPGENRAPRFKDWDFGEVRIQGELVTNDGGKMEFYIPHLAEQAGPATILLVGCLIKGRAVKVVDEATGDEVRIPAEEKKDGEAEVD